jgi:hypothetical protein
MNSKRKKFAPLELTKEQTFAVMAAVMGGVTWGLAPNKDDWTNGEDYCAGDRNIGDEIRFMIRMEVLQVDMTNPSVPLPGPYPFELGRRPIKS